MRTVERSRRVMYIVVVVKVPPLSPLSRPRMNKDASSLFMVVHCRGIFMLVIIFLVFTNLRVTRCGPFGCSIDVFPGPLALGDSTVNSVTVACCFSSHAKEDHHLGLVAAFPSWGILLSGGLHKFLTLGMVRSFQHFNKVFSDALLVGEFSLSYQNSCVSLRLGTEKGRRGHEL